MRNEIEIQVTEKKTKYGGRRVECGKGGRRRDGYT
jgi:hypothetical protein